jgi:hypothetical protein
VIAAAQNRMFRRVEEVHAAVYAELIGDAETAVLVAKMAMGVAIAMQTRVGTSVPSTIPTRRANTAFVPVPGTWRGFTVG